MRTFSLLFVLILIPFIHFGQTHSLLKNIGAGDEDGIPTINKSTDWNGKSYFISYDPFFYKNRIWSTDGTSANSSQVLTTSYVGIEFISSVDDYIIFNARVQSIPGIYRSKGSQSTTELLIETPLRDVVFMQNLDSNTVLFITGNYEGDTTSIWSTDGTPESTIHLGDFEIKPDYFRFSYYKDNIVFTEKSTGSDLFPPVITDGTIEGTMLVTDFINDVIDSDIADVSSAVGTSDFLFVRSGGYGKVFNGTEISDFTLGGDCYHGFKLDNLNIVFVSFGIRVYDSITETSVDFPGEPWYFSEPITNGSKVFFHSPGGNVYETDGTALGTKKLSSVTVGPFNYDPYLFATDDILIYSSNQANVELRIVDLHSGLDSLFSAIWSSTGQIVNPYVFEAGGNIVYAKRTAAEGREYWVYDPLQTGIRDLLDAKQISLSPNPAENELIISFGDEMPANSSLSIYNTTGQVLWSSAISSDRQVVDITGFTPGQYFIQLLTNKGSQYGGTFVKK